MSKVTKTKLFPGVCLTAVQTNKFKSSVLSVTLMTPLKKQTAAVQALIPYVLRRGSKNYPNMNALAAAAIGCIYGLTTEEILQGIESVQSMGGRFHQIKTDHLLIVDDCYNANPGSVKAAIDVLKESPGRRVAVLGDMFELGENEEALHREVGRHAVESGIDSLICVGGLSKAMAEEAEKRSAEKTGESSGGTQVFYRESREDLLNDLKSLIQEGDTVLVKASHSMGFEKIVEALRAL